ncbi:hypothetical protein OH781_30930 [Streptomyces sp. NBC_01550]|uniref:hypothetical protein n=1 Tax=Streptomyces sp. NBC_01550 TaxID=2975875 RepID=UPI003482C966
MESAHRLAAEGELLQLVLVGGDRGDREQEDVVLVEVLGEAVPDPFDGLFGLDEVLELLG